MDPSLIVPVGFALLTVDTAARLGLLTFDHVRSMWERCFPSQETERDALMRNMEESE